MRNVLCRYMLATFTSIFVVIAGSTPAQAVKIAIIDSGSNLSGVTGIDFVRGDDVPNDETESQHGTVISRIVNASVPVEDIVALKVVGASFAFDPAISSAALASAVSMPDVKVIDLSNRNPISLADLQAAVADGGRLLVINAGNRGKSSPDGIAEFAPLLDDLAIIVGAVDSNNVIEDYSNRAGNLAEYYVVAPGSTPISSTQGTSFAKPHVSGLATLLLTLFPNLDPKDAVKIIFETATDLGVPGVDPIYGWGLINPEAALGPEGEMVIPTESGSSGPGGAAIAGVVLVGAAVGIMASKKKDNGGEGGPLETTLVLDEYNRGYLMDLTQVTQVRPDRGSIGSILKSLNTLEETHMVSQTGGDFAFMRVTKPTRENVPSYNPTSWLNDDSSFDPEPSMSFYQQSLDGSGYSFHINQGLTNEFGALGLASEPDDQISFLSNKAFSSPFLGYSSNGYASHFTHAFTSNSSASFGLSRADDDTRFGLRSDSTVFEVSHKREKFSVSASFGQLYEYGSLFGGSRGGPFSVDDTLTFAFGFSGSYQLAPGIRVIGNYAQGYSQVDSADDAIVSNFSSLRSDSWGLGLMFDNLIKERDRIGFAVSQPLKVTSGSANLTVPYHIDANNKISSTTNSLNLGAGGRELAVETFYRMWLGKQTRFTTYFMHQRNPLNNTDLSSANSVLGVWEYRF